jgi:SAM-dependent methyltransferase
VKATVIDPTLLACPDDLGPITPSDNGLCCLACGRHFPSANGVWELLPRESLDLTSPEGQRLESYRAGYSRHPDRAWLQPIRVLIAELGNAYLYLWVSRVIEAFAAGRSLRILDAACGDGLLGRHIARRHLYVGVDFSARPLARASRYHPGTYIRGDLNRLPFAPQTFDVVVSLQALQYVEQPQRAVSEMARVLGVQGQLLLTLPNGGSFKYRLQGISPLQRHRFLRSDVVEVLAPHYNVQHLETQGVWLPVPIVNLHFPGKYSESLGLSWTAVGMRKT